MASFEKENATDDGIIEAMNATSVSRGEDDYDADDSKTKTGKSSEIQETNREKNVVNGIRNAEITEGVDVISLFLLGDSGTPNESTRKLADALKRQIDDAESAQAVVFLGDNFYPVP